MGSRFSFPQFQKLDSVAVNVQLQFFRRFYFLESHRAMEKAKKPQEGPDWDDAWQPFVTAARILAHVVPEDGTSRKGKRQLLEIELLPDVVRVVGDRCEVNVDGSILMGTDITKALSLGARAVFVGRPVIWGLAYDVRIFLLEQNVVVRKMQAQIFCGLLCFS
ncbi:hypothetical protein HPB48_019247 [Haemaphysalis longicornis]|uniref:FMN-dependent dehydrogenase domain-containing protein n=1 Tax=Haemaphysalis longicornis TaxID=44386 RepID=A0A9J6GTM5_HAELO|nr:hypothetical protein HPB48_019247 [Haemaphysalis longicornis]